MLEIVEKFHENKNHHGSAMRDYHDGSVFNIFRLREQGLRKQASQKLQK